MDKHFPPPPPLKVIQVYLTKKLYCSLLHHMLAKNVRIHVMLYRLASAYSSLN